jgi:hypothetical protein
MFCKDKRIVTSFANPRCSSYLRESITKYTPVPLYWYSASMALSLPLELLPIIFDSVVRAQHLAFLCLVNKSFNEFAIPRLYRRIYIYSWHTKAKAKVNTILFAMFIVVAHILNRSFYCSRHLRIVLVLHIMFHASVSPDQIMTPTSAVSTNPVIQR